MTILQWLAVALAVALAMVLSGAALATYWLRTRRRGSLLAHKGINVAQKWRT